MAEEIRPEVSILIAAWNSEATIGAAVQSALDQQGVAVEVIVVDDASTDGTRALVARMAAADPRLRLVSQPQNAGPAAARNKALKMSAAPWVTVLDSDDVLAPHRLAGMLALARSEGWDFVADDLYKVDSHPPRGPRQRLWSAEPIGKLSLTFESFVRGNLSRLHGGKGELGFLKPLMRRGFLRDRGLSYAEDMRLGEDYALYATALARGARFCLTDPMGYDALTRPGSLSAHHGAAELGALVAADRRLADEGGLTPTDRRVLREHETETLKKLHWVRLIDAVKGRDPAATARCFLVRPAVAASLVARLGEQAVLRSRAALRPHI